jgi:hypothetical protein
LIWKALTGVQSKYIQPKVNELVRIIDNGLPCIATGNFGKMAAGHYFHAGGHSQIRFNLHNIHIQSFQSNSFKSGDALNYRQGIIKTYGEEYIEFMESLKQTPIKDHTKIFYLELNTKLIEVKKWLKVQVNGQIQDFAKSNKTAKRSELVIGNL